MEKKKISQIEQADLCTFLWDKQFASIEHLDSVIDMQKNKNPSLAVQLTMIRQEMVACTGMLFKLDSISRDFIKKESVKSKPAKRKA